MTGLDERLALETPTVTQQATGYLFIFLLSFKVNIVIYTLLSLSWSNHCQLFFLRFGHCGVKASLAMNYLTEKNEKQKQTNNQTKTYSTTCESFFNVWCPVVFVQQHLFVRPWLLNSPQVSPCGLIKVLVMYSSFFLLMSIRKHHGELARTRCRGGGRRGAGFKWRQFKEQHILIYGPLNEVARTFRFCTNSEYFSLYIDTFIIYLIIIFF